MNANELAKLLEVDSWYKLVTREEVATTLRQQQAEIKALKEKVKQNAALEEKVDLCKEKLEPAAWMFQGAFDISTYVSFEKPNPDIYPNPTPLYTHPVKEPYNNAVGKTIEGGAELVSDSFVDFSKWISPVKTLTNDEILCLWDYWSGEILAIDILDFADKYKRAILNEEGIIEWHQEYCKKMNEEDAKKVDTYKLQKNNQIDTYRYKNLTDAEIEQILKQHDWYSKTWVDMVRSIESAILRKAQEK